MTQLTLFDKPDKHFLNRWHLYRGDQLMYTCIPSRRGVTLIGLPLPMKSTKEILRLTQSEYEAYRHKYKLEEATL